MLRKKARAKPLPPQACPYCEQLIDIATCLKGAMPGPGAIFFCIACTNFITFDEELVLRKSTKEDFDRVDHSERNKINSERLKLIIKKARVQAHSN